MCQLRMTVLFSLDAVPLRRWRRPVTAVSGRLPVGAGRNRIENTSFFNQRHGRIFAQVFHGRIIRQGDAIAFNANGVA